MGMLMTIWDEARDEALSEAVFGRGPLRPATMRVVFSGCAETPARESHVQRARRLGATAEFDRECHHANP